MFSFDDASSVIRREMFLKDLKDAKVAPIFVNILCYDLGTRGTTDMYSTPF